MILLKTFLLIGLTASSLFIAYLLIDKMKLAGELEEAQTEVLRLEKSYPSIYDYLNSITYTQFQQSVASKEKMIVYIGSSTCSDCSSFEKEMIPLIEKEAVMMSTIQFLNIARIYDDTEEQRVLKKTYNIYHTPTLAKFENGQLISKVEWTEEKGIDIEEVKEWMEENVKQE